MSRYKTAQTIENKMRVLWILHSYPQVLPRPKGRLQAYQTQLPISRRVTEMLNPTWDIRNHESTSRPLVSYDHYHLGISKIMSDASNSKPPISTITFYGIINIL